ncbi:lysylphosphatidylglycerol synthase domain-containing protein [Halosimplex aquaticum]
MRSTLSNQIRGVAGVLVVFAVGAPAAAVVGWRSRRRVGNFALRVVAPVARRSRFVSVEGLRDRMRELNTAFERIAADRTALAHALVYSFVGWLFFAMPLYFAVRAVGREISLFLVFFIVPASTLAGLTPSPGDSPASRQRSPACSGRSAGSPSPPASRSPSSIGSPATCSRSCSAGSPRSTWSSGRSDPTACPSS